MATAVSIKLPIVRNLQDLRRLDSYIEGPTSFREAVLTDFGRAFVVPPIGLREGRLYLVFNTPGLGVPRQAAISAVFAKGVWKYYPGGVPPKKLISGAGGMASSVGAKMGAASAPKPAFAEGGHSALAAVTSSSGALLKK